MLKEAIAAIKGAKVQLVLLSPIAKAAWSLAQYAGYCKYGAWNWRINGITLTDYLSAIDRHRDAYVSGEEHDPVDGTHHLGNIMACCAIILDAKAAGKLIDDRPPSVSLRPTYAEVEAAMGKLRALYADKTPKHYTITDTAPTAPAIVVEAWTPKVGDRVRVKTPCEYREGQAGTIDSDDPKVVEYRYGVRFEDSGFLWFGAFELEPFDALDAVLEDTRIPHPDAKCGAV